MEEILCEVVAATPDFAVEGLKPVMLRNQVPRAAGEPMLEFEFVHCVEKAAFFHTMDAGSFPGGVRL